jgi:hypothetical protein
MQNIRGSDLPGLCNTKLRMIRSDPYGIGEMIDMETHEGISLKPATT